MRTWALLCLFCSARAIIQPQAFADWIGASSVYVSDKLSLSPLRAVSLDAIQTGETLAKLPLSLVLHAIGEDHPSVVSLKQNTQASSLDGRTMLVLRLMEEWGTRLSPWRGWLNNLPAKLDVPLQFDEADLDLLKNHDAHARIQSYQHSVHMVWEPYVSKVAPPGFGEDDFVRFFALATGWATTISREDASPSILALLPVLSAAAHSNAPNAVVVFLPTAENENPVVQFNQGRGSFALQALRTIHANEQISVNYGFESNLDSFTAQGVVQDLPNLDSLSIVIEEPRDDLSAALTKAGITQRVFTLTPQSIPLSLLKFLRVKHGANVDDPAVLERITQGGAVTLDNDRLALSDLLSSVRAASRLFSSSIEEDRALLASGVLRSMSASAIHYRLREKLVLRGVETLIKEIWGLWLSLPESAL